MAKREQEQGDGRERLDPDVASSPMGLAAGRPKLPALDSLPKLASYAKAGYEWRWFLLRLAGYCSVSAVSGRLLGEEIPHRLMSNFFEGAVRQLGVHTVAEGTEKLRGALPCIIALNHNSLLDIPCAGPLFDFPYKWVAKRDLFAMPFIGWHLRAGGHIYVDRTRRDNIERLEREFRRELQAGNSILLFPEGTRSADGALKPFRSGAFVTAVKENVPVVPVVLNGTEKLLVKGSLGFPKGQRKLVEIKILDPVYPPSEDAGSFDQRVVWMRDRTRAAMVEGLDALRGEVGAAERPTSR